MQKAWSNKKIQCPHYWFYFPVTLFELTKYHIAFHNSTGFSSHSPQIRHISKLYMLHIFIAFLLGILSIMTWVQVWLSSMSLIQLLCFWFSFLLLLSIRPLSVYEYYHHKMSKAAEMDKLLFVVTKFSTYLILT